MADPVYTRNALDPMSQPGGRPIMPEEHDRYSDPPVMSYARAFGAGLVDPMGLPSWAANALARTPGTDWYKRRMQEARDESPVAAGIGSAVVPSLIGGPLLGGTMSETAAAMPVALQIGGGVGSLRDILAPPPRKQRPQAAYPPGGAY